MMNVLCAVCGKADSVLPSRAKNYVTCSRKCNGIHLSKIKSEKIEICCEICQSKFFEKPSHAEARRTCSKACFAKLKSIEMQGDANHQYGLRADERGAAWKGGKRLSSYGYVLILVGDVYQFEHRLVMEKKLGRSLTSTEHVHHKNEIRTDNHIDNLEIMEPGEHMRLHKLLNPVQRDEITKRFTKQ